MKYNKNEVTGKMRDRIILQNVTRSRSLSGFASESWSDTTTIWAFAESKLPGSNETIIEGKNTAKNICDFTIRYISSITEESRVVFKNKIYQVKNIKISHDRRFISFQGVYYDSYSTVIGLQSCSASLLAQSSLSAALMRVIKYQASLNAFGSVSADIALVQKVASSLNAFGTLSGDITFVQNMQAALNGTAALSGGINFVQKPEASLLTSSSVTGNIIIPKLVQASLTGAGTTTADLTVTAAASLLLDLYPSAAAAYSLRKLRSAYTGSAIRVRASTSGAEGDVSFDVNSTISASSTVTVTAVGTSGLSIGQQVTFSTFWNAGGSNQNVFVTTWYDQSGNGRDATQTTQANQPQIVSSGVVISTNSKPSVRFNGTSNVLNGGNILSVDANPFFISQVAKQATTGDMAWYSKAIANTSLGRHAVFNENNIISSLVQLNSGGLKLLNLGASLTTRLLISSEFIPNTSFKGYVNNIEKASNTTVSIVGTNNLNFRLGGYGDTTGAETILFFNGEIQEFIFYLSNQTTNRSNINSNINTYYGIY